MQTRWQACWCESSQCIFVTYPCAQTQNYDAMQLEMASPRLRSSGESAKLEREVVLPVHFIVCDLEV